MSNISDFENHLEICSIGANSIPFSCEKQLFQIPKFRIVFEKSFSIVAAKVAVKKGFIIN